MKTRCAYCGQWFPDKPPFESDTVSHTICGACLDYFAAQWDGQRLGEYLDRYPFPVLVCDDDGRVLAINARSERELGIGNRQSIGLLGGELMECVHARLPGGCGATIHCPACTLRGTITHTYQTGEPIFRESVSVEKIDGIRWFSISTCKTETGVAIVVNEALGRAEEPRLPRPRDDADRPSAPVCNDGPGHKR